MEHDPEQKLEALGVPLPLRSQAVPLTENNPSLLETTVGPEGGIPAAGPGDFAPAIPGYRITGRLGEGGMGVVWRAIQEGTQRQVALKLASAASFGSERARLRFHREIELAARLEHPGIARVYEGGESRGVCFYAMELVDGVPLDRYVRDHKLPRRQILELMQRVCDAVRYAHQKGVIHRDLKPSNILVDADGQPHVLDFGLAKATAGDDAQQISTDGMISGTPAYMSPEQAAGLNTQVDTRSDVYTLGVILFHLLSGKFPHSVTGSSFEVIQRIATEEPMRLKQLHPRADRDLDAMLSKALSREPEHRYATAAGLGDDLRRYLSGDPVIARPPSLAYRFRKRVRKRRKAVMIGSLLLAMLLTIGGYVAYDYYSQWGDWIEVARYDFTSEKSTTDGLEFISLGAFSTAAPAWTRDADGLQAKSGQWCVFKNVHIRGDAHIVVNIAFGDHPDGFDLNLNSGVFNFQSPPGYSAQVGGYEGQVDFISRNERQGDPDESEAIAGNIQPGRLATIVFERQGEHLTLQVDNEPPIRLTELLPLTGTGLDGVAIRSWSETARIRAIAIYRRSLPKKASPVVAGDALVEAGDLDAALRQYETLADDYARSLTGEIALAKACELASAVRPLDHERVKRIRERFSREYPGSAFREQLLESDILADWQDDRFDEALQKLEQARQLNPQTRLALRMVASARMRNIALPAPIAQMLMARVRQLSGVSRLNVDGLGVDSLAGIVRPELRSLRCSQNPIQTLEPLRGIPIVGLWCDSTAVSSLEPLRDGGLRRIHIDNTEVTDLGPLRGMPIEELWCERRAISSLEPVSGMVMLKKLHIRGTHVSSLDPIRGLPITRLEIGWTPIRNLDPIKGMPLNGLECHGCQITSLDVLRSVPLASLSCDDNLIQSLEPLRGMSLRSLECRSNGIRTLEALGGMPLRLLAVDNNPLTSLEPFVENPPAFFTFDCDSLPDAELVRVRDIWARQPEHRRLALDATILLTLRQHDLPELQRLASPFRGHRYLFLPKRVSWPDASRLCQSLGGHLAVIPSAEVNVFIGELCRDINQAPWIGLRNDAGRPTWENGNAVSFSLARSGPRPQLMPGGYGIYVHDGWAFNLPENKINSFIIEWDSDALTADGPRQQK